MTNGTATSGDGGGKRWGITTWLLVFAVIGVTVAAFLGLFGRWDRGIPAGAVKAGEVASSGVSYYGQEVKIYGYVSEVLNGRLFLMSDVVQGTVQLPVFLRESDTPVALGDNLVIEGIPAAYDAGKFRQNYGIELPEALARQWNDQPVVLANTVRKLG